MVDGAKPALQRFFEAVATIMGLDRGRHRLELTFTDGRLERVWMHAESVPPTELAAFDDRAAWLVSEQAAG